MDYRMRPGAYKVILSVEDENGRKASEEIDMVEAVAFADELIEEIERIVGETMSSRGLVPASKPREVTA